MLVPLATPEIVMGAMLFLVFTTLYTAIPLGRPAQMLGHVTFSLSYVVVIVRGRLLTIGRDVRGGRAGPRRVAHAGAPHGAPAAARPAIFASFMIVFATSIDDFVVSSFLSADASSETVPMRLYSAVRTAPTPA